ncbi:ATP-binding protein [Desulfosporosinus sp. PR]|uniref:ATP-binding protein n=1 Tax=Candidatus Desulfosporosinus nitrosoreducens TaxID=3401928 RepID=UPI0027F51BA8|nr:ATP-binding protein [Desulfosporosinus sp. PR]MDQ7095185.1 ATP-binding protein [Desulfosporosinus sp. PR]
MKKRWPLQAAAGILAVLIALCLCWSAAFFATLFIYKLIGINPSAFVRQLLNSLLGFFCFGNIIFVIGMINRPKQSAVFQPIIDALRRIAKGDFNINLSLGQRNHPYSEIVESINHMAGELSQIEQMRQEFISNVSHELQSPLTSISGFAKGLKDDNLSREKRLHYLEIIETESLRLAKLSENLLKLTSLESEHHPFELKRYRLDKQLRKIVLACEPQWVEKALVLDIDLEEASIVADEELMSQVWVNLINNSIKFTPREGSISVCIKKEESETVVRIADTGIGLSAEDQAHIFERFYKADKSRNRSQSGSGLGLAIVKKIVDLHQGTIEVNSKPGEGTAFKVFLPIS